MDMGGGCPCVLKVVDASVPSLGLLEMQGAPCLLLYLALPVYHVGPLTDMWGLAQLQGQKNDCPSAAPSAFSDLDTGRQVRGTCILQGKGK